MLDRRQWVRPIAITTIVFSLLACGGGPDDSTMDGVGSTEDTAGSAGEATQAEYADYTMPPGIEATAIKKCKSVVDARTESFDIPANRDSLLEFSRESQDPGKRYHAVWVWPRATAVRVTLRELAGYPLLLQVEVEPADAVPADERWANLFFDTQSCEDAIPIGSEVLAIRQTGAEFLPTSIHFSKKHALTVMKGNSTYVLGTPGMIGATADSAGGPPPAESQP